MRFSQHKTQAKQPVKINAFAFPQLYTGDGTIDKLHFLNRIYPNRQVEV